MNCPKCGTAVPDTARQCPACGSTLDWAEADPTWAGNVKPSTVAAKATTANDVTVAVPTPKPAQNLSNDALTSPSFGSTPPQTPSDSATVDFGPRYRVERLLGKGGMGAVYLAYDQELGRQVALKLVRPELMVYPEAMERFRQELLLASKISHRNVLRIHDLGDAGGTKFISMAYVDGEDLHHLLAREGSLPLDRMLNITRQLCAALDAAHSEGVVHRDLKPQNIMLGKDDHVFVSDFGLAKSLGEVGGMTQSGDMLGTPRYMAPEQVDAKHVDARTDIYALGLIFYEMLTGDVPFTAETTLQLMYKRAHETPPAPKTINPDISDWLNNIVMKCLERDPANRYQGAKEILDDIDAQRKPPAPQVTASGVAAPCVEAAQAARQTKSRRYIWIAAAAVVAIGLGVGGWLYFKRPARALTDKDTIVLSDFDNKTGDPVFDDTLKQGLAVQLEQSPFLDLVPDRKVNQTLKLMGRSAGDRLTPEVAREICQRTSSKAMLSGSIAELGSQYVIGLKAVNCNTGDALAEAQEQAAGKEAVLKALDAGAVSLRGKLGESLSSVKQYATPVEEATTPSLEALQAYSLGRKVLFAKGGTAALPFFKRAVELDPNFAMPYRSMASTYANLNQVGLAAENARKAFDLREKVSERERFSIESLYYTVGTGELEKAAQVYELWQQTYPRDYVAYANLTVVYAGLGNWEKALDGSLEAMRLEPNSVVNYVSLGDVYASLNRLDEAQEVYKQADERKLEAEILLQVRYQLAFLTGDGAKMAELASAAIGKPGAEDRLLTAQACTEGWYGKLKDSRELAVRAMNSAEHHDAKETAAAYQAGAALREVEWGDREQARTEANAALKLAPNRDVKAVAALALARAGDTAGAERLADELNKTFPLDTVVQRYWLPTVRAANALEHKDPNRAIDLLKETGEIELSQSTSSLEIWLCPAYLRGEAYLMLHDGNRAAAEFQKFIDHRGLVVNFPWGALAHLGLARAYALQKDTAKAKAAYQDFLTLWKDADPDIPILKQAKSEQALNSQ